MRWMKSGASIRQAAPVRRLHGWPRSGRRGAYPEALLGCVRGLLKRAAADPLRCGGDFCVTADQPESNHAEDDARQLKGLWAPASRQLLEPRPRDCDQFAGIALSATRPRTMLKTACVPAPLDRPSHRAIHLMPPPQKPASPFSARIRCLPLSAYRPIRCLFRRSIRRR